MKKVLRLRLQSERNLKSVSLALTSQIVVCSLTSRAGWADRKKSVQCLLPLCSPSLFESKVQIKTVGVRCQPQNSVSCSGTCVLISVACGYVLDSKLFSMIQPFLLYQTGLNVLRCGMYVSYFLYCLIQTR